MQEDKDQDRIEVAKHLANRDPRAAAEAFRVIACDDQVDGGLRLQVSRTAGDVASARA
jgi:hypothetical protein